MLATRERHEAVVIAPVAAQPGEALLRIAAGQQAAYSVSRERERVDARVSRNVGQEGLQHRRPEALGRDRCPRDDGGRHVGDGDSVQGDLGLLAPVGVVAVLLELLIEVEEEGLGQLVGSCSASGRWGIIRERRLGSRDLGQDVAGLCLPDERLWGQVVLLNVGLDRCDEVSNAREGPSQNAFSS